MILKLLAVIDRLGQHAGPTPPFPGVGLPDKPARRTYSLREQAAGQLKKLDTAVANSGDADVARF